MFEKKKPMVSRKNILFEEEKVFLNQMIGFGVPKLILDFRENLHLQRMLSSLLSSIMKMLNVPQKMFEILY